MTQNAPKATAQMLIRKPVEEVFEAFVNPAITTKFWFTKSSGKLEPGKEVWWDWEMYGVSAQVSVKAVEKNKRILLEWSTYGSPSPVEWTFTAREDNTTLVRIANWGFSGSPDEIVKEAVDATGGFTLVLAGLKALLEHNVVLNLVADHYPDARQQSGA